MTTFGKCAAACAVALATVACGGSMAEKSDPVRDPAHLDAEHAPVILAPDLTASEKLIKIKTRPDAGTP
jgi:hypothetical protein